MKRPREGRRVPEHEAPARAYSPVMRAALLMVILGVAVRAVLGGFGGSAVLCLGGHHAVQGPQDCAAACEHQTAWPSPAPVDEHDEECGCIDLSLGFGELVAVLRSASAAPVTVPSTHQTGWIWAALESDRAWRGPPLTPWRCPDGAQGVSALHTVRLTI